MHLHHVHMPCTYMHVHIHHVGLGCLYVNLAPPWLTYAAYVRSVQSTPNLNLGRVQCSAVGLGRGRAP